MARAPEQCCVGELEGLGAVPGPRPGQRQGPQRVEAPDGVLRAGKAQRATEPHGGLLEVAAQEARDGGVVLGHDPHRLGAAHAQEVDDVVILEAREHVEDALSRGDHGFRWQAAEHLGGVQGVGCGAFTGGEIRAPHQGAVGLGCSVGQIGGDLRSKEADDDARRGSGVLALDGAQPPRERCGLAALEEAVAESGDLGERLVVLAGPQQVLDRLLGATVFMEPPRGTRVQGARGRGVLGLELIAQQLGEEVVVAEVGAGHVQRDDEQ